MLVFGGVSLTGDDVLNAFGLFLVVLQFAGPLLGLKMEDITLTFLPTTLEFCKCMVRFITDSVPPLQKVSQRNVITKKQSGPIVIRVQRRTLKKWPFLRSQDSENGFLGFLFHVFLKIISSNQ